MGICDNNVIEIILFAPEIPQNTGNVARTCSVTGAHLTLVKPLGFSLSNRQVKRAGLDYWDALTLRVIDDLEAHLMQEERPFYFFSSKVERPYTDIPFSDNARLIFGSETQGLPAPFFERWEERYYTIPMRKEARCLNLSNAANIVLYEALRQLHFEPLQKTATDSFC